MTHALEIRQATAPDAAAIDSVVHEAFFPYITRIGVRPVPMLADYPALIDAGHVWVAASRAGAICGVIVVVPEQGHLLLETIAVSNDVRGRGVGAALMAFAEEQARMLELPTVHLYTNELMWENLTYYPKLGYVEVERATVNKIYRRVFFTKTLS